MPLPAGSSKAPPERRSVVARPLPLLIVLIASCVATGYAIYALIRAGAL